MHDSDKQDWLDDALRRPPAPIEDAGFSQRVMQALPARARGDRFRVAILLVSTLLAGLVCFLLLPAGGFVFETVGRMLTLSKGFPWGALVVVLASLAMLVWMPLVLVEEEA
jgi:hypothetical protein